MCMSFEKCKRLRMEPNSRTSPQSDARVYFFLKCAPVSFFELMRATAVIIASSGDGSVGGKPVTGSASWLDPASPPAGSGLAARRPLAGSARAAQPVPDCVCLPGGRPAPVWESPQYCAGLSYYYAAA